MREAARPARMAESSSPLPEAEPSAKAGTAGTAWAESEKEGIEPRTSTGGLTASGQMTAMALSAERSRERQREGKSGWGAVSPPKLAATMVEVAKARSLSPNQCSDTSAT